jgi:cullin-associated NEDD8-dissociated protein 1
MGLLQDYYSDGIGETNARDAHYETSAILDHYFYHESTAPFVCIRLIQRFGISNPSPRYVAACSEAFKTGTYTSGTVEFGTGEYGDLEAAAAAVSLDREATSPVLDMEPGAGSLREPLMKIIALMRNLEYTHAPRETFAELWRTQNRISQEAYEFPSVFSFFL